VDRAAGASRRGCYTRLRYGRRARPPAPPVSDWPRRLLYLADVTAKRCDPALKAMAERLSTRGKPAKLITVAVMRKLVEAANLVLSRGQPWLKQPAI
jgi:transposase